MDLFASMGLISTICLALPLLILVFSKLAWYKSFPAIAVYYLLIISHNLFSLGYLNASKNFIHYHGLINNILDVPLVLVFLSYFSQTALFRKRILFTAAAFLGFELVVLLIAGITVTATTIMLGPGILLILGLSLFYFLHQVKITVVYQKAAGKAVMAASVIFAYVGFAFVYIVYYLLHTDYLHDTKLVYFLVSGISSLGLAVGILIEKRRVTQLEELRLVREELKEIYGEEPEEKNTTAPFEAIVFKMDKKSWG